ncbi:MAG: cadherin domain-containing protein [Planctomycetota bacterium]|nr:cadherin domain-containing protein [Planctomycetota bacterium]
MTVTGTLAQINNLLTGGGTGTIVYFNGSNTPSASTTITVTVNDGGNTGSDPGLTGDGSSEEDKAVQTINITAVNDEQVLATNTGRTVNENSTGNVINNTQLHTTDLDNTTSQLVYTITTATSNGSLRLSGTALSVSSTFTQADIDAGLITYDHNGSETSSDSFSFSVDDGAGSASTGTFNITITPVNDNSPVITSNGGGLTASVNVAENSTAVTTVTATDGDLPGQTLTYSISGDDAGLFTIDLNTGVLEFTSGRNRESHSDFDSNGIYEVTVQVSDGTLTDSQAISVTITDLNEFNVSVPTDSDAATNEVDENVIIGTTVGLTANAFDLDATNNTITYSLTSNPDGLFQIDVNTGVVTTAAAIDRESHGALRSITVQAASSDGSTQTQSFNIAINDQDEFDVTVPTDVNASSNSVAENATVGTVVGITAYAEDLDSTNNTIAYTLDDNAGGLFAIDGVTGVVTVNGALDYETATSHNIVVRASSSDGSSDTQSFTINVTNVNESGVTAISDIDATADFVLENVSVGTVVGLTAFADDIDVIDTVSYSLDDNAGGLFSIDSTTGVVTVAGAIDREAGASYNITVRATSTDTSTITRVFTIAIGDIDEFDVSIPTDSNASVNAVNENVVVGTTVGLTANAFDLDATNNTITYSLTSNPDGLFQIDVNTGVVTTAAAIDRETHGALRSISVQAASSDGSVASQSFNIAINDLDEFDVTIPTDTDVAINGVDENVATGTTVGLTANAFDLDSTNNTITYSLTSNPDGLFQIDANTGVVTTAAAIDRESHGAVRSITVQAASSDGSVASQSFNIAINDLDEFDVTVPTDADAAITAVNENVATGTTVGLTANAFDLDSTNNTITYSLTSNPDGLFQIDASTGVVTTAAAIDRESHGAVRSITVQAASSDGSVASQSFNIAINDLDEYDVTVPTDTDAAINAVDENVATGTTVGLTANAFDLDSTNNTITYSLTSNPDGLFQIDANTGVVTTAAAIDRETHGAVRSITVQATSSDGSVASQSFNININDLDEFDVTLPTDSDGAVNEVDENVATGTTVGLTANAFDLDATNNTITYMLDDDAGGLFAIDGTTGVVTVNGTLDYESATSHNITVRASSSDGSFAIQAFVVNVINVNEAPVTAVPGVQATNQDTSLLFSTATANAIVISDVDVGNNPVIVTLSVTNGTLTLGTVAGLTFGTGDGASDATMVFVGTLVDVNVALNGLRYDPTPGFSGSAQLQITVDDQGNVGSGGAKTDLDAIDITVHPVISANNAPAANADTFVGIQFEPLSVAAPGLLANDSDPDNDPISAVLVQGPQYGTLVLHADGSFTYTPDSVFSGVDSFQYQVSDGLAWSAPVTVTLQIQAVGIGPGGGGSGGGGTGGGEGGGGSTGNGEGTVPPSSGGDNSSSAPAATVEIVAILPPTNGPSTINRNASIDTAVAERTSETSELAAAAIDAATSFVVNGAMNEWGKTGLRVDEWVDRGAMVRVAYETVAAAISRDILTLDFGPEQTRNDADSWQDELSAHGLAVGTSAIVSTSLSVGYIVWMLRGGTLFLSFISSIPAWCAFDPLPIVESFEESVEKKDEEKDEHLSLLVNGDRL